MKYKLMYLVLGGTGFVGKHLVKELLRKKKRVRILSRTPQKISGCDVVLGDISSYADVDQAVKGCETVFHLVKYKGHNTPYKKRYATDILGIQNVMKAAFQHNAKVVYMSSTAVMMPFNTPYMRIKRDAENIIKKYWEKVPSIIVRAPRIYNRDVLKSLFSKPPFVPNIDVKVHFCYIYSVVDALIKASKKNKSAVYVIGDKRPVDFLKLAKKVNPNIVVVPKLFVPVAILLAYPIEFLHNLFGATPPLTPEFIKYILAGRNFDTSKARRELKFKQFDTLKMI